MATIVKETDKYFVLSEIKKQHEKSGGHCGILLSDLAQLVKISIDDLKETIRELCREKKITWHDTARGLTFKMKIEKAN